MSKSTSCTAASPPKCFVTFSPSSIRILPLQPSFPPLLYQAYHAMRQEQDNDNQDTTEKEHIVVGKLRCQYFFEVSKNGGAKDRTIKLPCTAKDSHQNRHKRKEGIKGNSWINICPFCCHDCPGGSHEEGADSNGDRLPHRCIDAYVSRGLLIFPDASQS